MFSLSYLIHYIKMKILLAVAIFCTIAKAFPLKPVLILPNSTHPNPFYNFTDKIKVVKSVEESFGQDGPVYIQATGEICTGDEPVNTKDVDFSKTNVTFDIAALPKVGSKKYCVSNLKNTKVVPMTSLRAPVSPCLDSSLGDGGSITKGLSVSVSLSLDFPLKVAVPILNLASVQGHISAGVSVSLSFSHSCTAAPGDSIQMWVTPMVGLTDFEYTTYNEWAGGKYGYSEAKRVYDFQFPVGGYQPAVQCLRGLYVDCGALTTNNFVLDNPILE